MQTVRSFIDIHNAAEAIMHAVKSDIKSSQYLPGRKIPSIRELAARYHQSTSCIKKALQRLVDEKILCIKNRSGYYVTAFPASCDGSAIAHLTFVINSQSSVYNYASETTTKFHEYEASRRNIPVSYCPTKRCAETERLIMQRLLNDPNTAAIFVHPVHRDNNDLFMEAEENGLRWIYIHDKPSETGNNFIGTDNYLFGRIAAETLLRCDGDCFLLIGYADESGETAGISRNAGFRDKVQTHDLPLYELLSPSRSPENITILEEFILSHRLERPKIFCATEYFTRKIATINQTLAQCPGYQLIGADYSGLIDGSIVTCVHQPKETEAALVSNWIFSSPADTNKKTQIFLRPVFTPGGTTQISSSAQLYTAPLPLIKGKINA